LSCWMLPCPGMQTALSITNTKTQSYPCRTNTVLKDGQGIPPVRPFKSGIDGYGSRLDAWFTWCYFEFGLKIKESVAARRTLSRRGSFGNGTRETTTKNSVRN
jgi:hypothetical protein